MLWLNSTHPEILSIVILVYDSKEGGGRAKQEARAETSIQ